MSTSRAVLPFALLCLTACATKPPYQARLADTQADCVERFESVRRHPLAVLDAKSRAKAPYVEFADVAQCLRTAQGSTALALYAIDEASRPAQVDISILPSPSGTFAASAELQDARFQRIERHSFAEFTHRGGEYSLSLFLDRAGPVYLMLVPDQDQVGKQESMIGSVNNQMVVPAGPVMFAVNHGAETQTIRAFMAGGRLKVTMRPEGSAAFSH